MGQNRLYCGIIIIFALAIKCTNCRVEFSWINFAKEVIDDPSGKALMRYLKRYKAEAAALRVGECPRPAHEFSREQLDFGVLIGGLLSEHVPDHDQQLARDRGDGFHLIQAVPQALELGLPEGAVLDRTPGRFAEPRA